MKKNPPKYILLIWESLPESVSFYLIPRANISKEDLSILHKCHGNYINNAAEKNLHGGRHTPQEVDEALAWLNEMLLDPDKSKWVNKDYCKASAEQLGIGVERFQEGVLGKLVPYLIDTEKPRIIPRARIIRTGFLL